jgi:hypothetical protein
MEIGSSRVLGKGLIHMIRKKMGQLIVLIDTFLFFPKNMQKHP